MKIRIEVRPADLDFLGEICHNLRFEEFQKVPEVSGVPEVPEVSGVPEVPEVATALRKVWRSFADQYG
ncbi:MAG: hypothetical protein DI535_07515 [Citrobacter freundii]|nr:MAG: hypothetical protein DI535_07515 [Citrobacter freundii]